MSPPSATGDQRILHVRPEPTGGVRTDKIDAEWAALALPVEVCPDVYRALARLCDVRRRDYPIAVVLVDALGDAEMEFFSIAARVCRSTTVYVYGDERLRARLDDACERGASGIVTPGTLNELMATAVMPTAPAVSEPVDPIPPRESVWPPSDSHRNGATGVVETNENRSAASVERAALAPPVSEEVTDPLDLLDEDPEDAVAAESMEVDADETDPDLDTDDDGSDETDDESPDVRVPWLRYPATPARSGPPPRGPIPNERRDDTSPRPRSILREPLLTDEELRALLGDDDTEADEVLKRGSPNPASEDEDQRS